jgi:glycosidase
VGCTPSTGSDAAFGPALSDYPETPLLEGAAHPARLRVGSSDLSLADWFGPDFEADSVRFDPRMRGTATRSRMGIIPSPDLPPVSKVRVFKDGAAYDIPVFRSVAQNIELQYRPPAGENPQKVQIAAGFNNWNPAAHFMTRDGGIWKARLPMKPGRYPYQLVVDGRWMLDPANPDSMDNNIGGYNSVLRVERPTGLPFLRPQRADAEGIHIGVGLEGRPSAALDEDWEHAVWWNYRLLGPEHVERTENGLRILPPAQSDTEDGGVLTVLAWNGEGRSNDLRIPLRHGQPIREVPTGPAAEGSGPYAGQTMYFALVDRFANGEEANDAPSTDPRILPPANFFGGDLQGLRAHLDYIKEMGCNTLWVSPIARNPEGAFQEYPEPRRWFSGYHGYWPISYREVDPRFGGDQALEALIEEAHARGMRVLLDFVANHVHEQHPMLAAHPDWTTELDLPDGRRNLRLWDEQRLTTWFDDFLPSLDLQNPAVVEAVTDSALFWIDRFNLDGFRHDATKHIPLAFQHQLTAKLKARFPERRLYQIGETFGERDLIASYLGPGLLDAQFDFPFYFGTRSVLTSPEPNLGRIAEELRASLEAYGHHHAMGNISGNHDMARFASLAGGGIAPGEDAKEAGWQRRVGLGDSARALERTEWLIGLNAAIPGVPVIYYGDEIGMAGGGDPDSRRMMRFGTIGPAQDSLRARAGRCMRMRSQSPALVYGSTEILTAEKDHLLLCREWFDERVYVGLNTGSSTKVTGYDGNAHHLPHGLSYIREQKP